MFDFNKLGFPKGTQIYFKGSVVDILRNCALYVKNSKVQIVLNICGVFSDLVAFVQFKKREENPWRSVNFSKVAG